MEQNPKMAEYCRVYRKRRRERETLEQAKKRRFEHAQRNRSYYHNKMKKETYQEAEERRAKRVEREHNRRQHLTDKRAKEHRDAETRRKRAYRQRQKQKRAKEQAPKARAVPRKQQQQETQKKIHQVKQSPKKNEKITKKRRSAHVEVQSPQRRVTRLQTQQSQKTDQETSAVQDKIKNRLNQRHLAEFKRSKRLLKHVNIDGIAQKTEELSEMTGTVVKTEHGTVGVSWAISISKTYQKDIDSKTEDNNINIVKVKEEIQASEDESILSDNSLSMFFCKEEEDDETTTEEKNPTRTKNSNDLNKCEQEFQVSHDIKPTINETDYDKDIPDISTNSNKYISSSNIKIEPPDIPINYEATSATSTDFHVQDIKEEETPINKIKCENSADPLPVIYEVFSLNDAHPTNYKTYI